MKTLVGLGGSSKSVAAMVAVALCAFLSNLQPVVAATEWSPETTVALNLPGAARLGSAVAPSGRAVLVWDEKTGIDFPVTYNGVYAAVRPSANASWGFASRIAGVGARNAGSVVDPVSGKVTVFWDQGGASYASSSGDAGFSWSTQKVPAAAGYAVPVGAFAAGSPFVDVDGSGTITLILVKARVSPSSVFDVQALTRSSSGKWGTAVTLTGTEGATFNGRSKLNVLADRSAFLNIGFTTFRRSTSGKWSRQTVDASTAGPVDSVSADIDRNGTGYFVVRSAAYGAMLATSTPGKGWTPLQPVPALGGLFNLRVAGASGGKAVVIGNVSGTAEVGISATSDGGVTWSAVENFGFGLGATVQGSENGMFASSWVSSNGATYVHATVSGSGPGNWQGVTFGANLPGFSDEDAGTVSISGNAGSATAAVVTGWPQIEVPSTTRLVGATSGTVSP